MSTIYQTHVKACLGQYSAVIELPGNLSKKFSPHVTPFDVQVIKRKGLSLKLSTDTVQIFSAYLNYDVRNWNKKKY